MISDKNPKDIEGWKSSTYVKWIRDNANCMACGEPLRNEKEGYVSHHHGHHRKNDLSLVGLCLRDHNALALLGVQQRRAVQTLWAYRREFRHDAVVNSDAVALSAGAVQQIDERLN